MPAPHPVDAPAAPRKGMRIFALARADHPADLHPLQRWCLGDCHTVSRVNGRSFTVSCGGQRRFLLVEWHAWLGRLQEDAWTWLLPSDDDPAGWRPLRPAPLHPLTLASKQARPAGWARDQRRLRAMQQVLPHYRLDRVDGREGSTVVTVDGGSRAYRVVVDRAWATEPTCDCPDAVHRRDLHGGHCKHVFAVLLRWPDLRAQLLSALL